MTFSSNNIVLFPKANDRITPPISLEEIQDAAETVRMTHIQQALETTIPMLFDNLSLMGFMPNAEQEIEFVKDGALVVEAVRSFCSKFYDIEHPLQLIAENLFEKLDNEGNIEVSNNVKIVITSNEGKS